jgi:hypothetical protein
VLNREEEPCQICVYLPHKVRTGEQSTRRPDAVILDELDETLVTDALTANPFIFGVVMPLNRKRKQQNCGEFNVRCMLDVKSPSRIGANRRVIALK